MATYKKGITGPFSGKIGPVVGSTWNGIDYMRSLPRKSKKAPSIEQKAQRLKLSMAIGFLSPISSVVTVGFRGNAVKQTGFNLATSQLIMEAISGDYPAYSIDFNKVLISIGSLTGPWNATVSSDSASTVTVSWTDNTGSGTAKGTDKAIIVVYNPERSEFVYTMKGAERSSALDTVTVPASFSGENVNVWVAFVSASSGAVSTSIYAGGISIA